MFLNSSVRLLNSVFVVVTKEETGLAFKKSSLYSDFLFYMGAKSHN